MNKLMSVAITILLACWLVPPGAALAQTDAESRWRLYQALAARDVKPKESAVAGKTAAATVDQQP